MHWYVEIFFNILQLKSRVLLISNMLQTKFWNIILWKIIFYRYHSMLFILCKIILFKFFYILYYNFVLSNE